MGGSQSKEEQLFQAVQNANHTAVKTLRRDGTSLEWADKDGRTPLILACTRSELFDMVITLLNLGASIKAYRPGSHGGYPLHHAAKRGLDKTVILLLSRGADPLALNDDGQTALDMARNRGHVSVVRIIEDRICLFSGVLREISGPGFLEALAPQWVTKKIWAVVLPSSGQSRRHPKIELVIYQSPKVPLPRIIISLAKAQIEEPNFNLADPVMILADRASKTRFKFLSEFEGRRAQLEKLFRACKGLVQASTMSSPQESVSPTRSRSNGPPITIVGPKFPPPQPISSPPQQSPSKVLSPAKEEDIPEDVALAMAINASIQSANAEGLVVPPASCSADERSTSPQWSISPPKCSSKRRGSVDSRRNKHSGGGAWSDSDRNSFWGSPEAGPSRVYEPCHQTAPPSTTRVSSRERAENIWETRPVRNPPVRNVPVRDASVPPTAPPFPAVQVYAPATPPPAAAPDVSETAKAVANKGGAGFSLFGIKKKGLSQEERGEEKATGQCVVCWDAPARGVCIPCGHLAGCMNCLLEIKEKTWGCPVCRTSIQQVIKVFTV